MTDDQHHLAGAYVLDALSPAERRDYEAHYPTCEICTGEVQEFRATAAQLGDAAATPPPADLKARVMAEVAVTRQLPPLVDELAERRMQRGGRSARLTAALAAAAAIVAVVALAVTLRAGSDSPTLDELIAAPDAVATALDGDDGAVTVVWSPGADRVAVLGTNLADPGAGRTYELWLMTDDEALPAGLFTPSNGIVGRVLEVDDLAARGWGITIEPAGGSDQPTGEILYAGTI